MARHRIAVLPGDGIGKDVMDAAMLVLKALKFDAEYVHGDVGWEFWCREGDPLPKRTIDMMKTTECCLFGAITSKPKEEAAAELDPKLKDKGFVYFSPIVGLRQEFDLYSNMRPCKAYPGNPLNYRDDIDLVVFRENTECLYAGVEFHPLPEDLKLLLIQKNKKMGKFKDVPSDEIAVSLRIFTKNGCRRILRSAFEYARKNKRKSVTVVEKPNVVRETSGMMVNEARMMAKEYPDVELWEANVDAMCMWLVKNPQDYDVLVSSNMFGDIISDLCGQLVGGLGFSPSANIGKSYGLFEPTHGSAPKYAGMFKVNPTAMLLSTVLMLDYISEAGMARKLERAISSVVKEGKVRTYDTGGKNTTIEVAEEVARNL